MSMDLSKGERVSLAKVSPGTKIFKVALGWDENPDFDLDASAFLCSHNASGDPKLTPVGTVTFNGNNVPAGFIFYGNLASKCGAVTHSGDNLTGAGDGDDEIITVDTSKLADDVVEIPFVITIYQAKSKGQNFGQVKGAFIRVLDETGTEILRRDLTEDYSKFTALQAGSFYKKDGDWRFVSIDQGYDVELGEILAAFQ